MAKSAVDHSGTRFYAFWSPGGKSPLVVTYCVWHEIEIASVSIHYHHVGFFSIYRGLFPQFLWSFFSSIPKIRIFCFFRGGDDGCGRPLCSKCNLCLYLCLGWIPVVMWISEELECEWGKKFIYFYFNAISSYFHLIFWVVLLS